MALSFLSFGVFDNLFILIGILFLLYSGIKVLHILFVILRTYIVPGYQDFKKYGNWAVVTGATDGIGKEYALQLAQKGLNIALISRTQSKLDSVAKEITEKTGVKTQTIAADFSHGISIYDDIKAKLAGLDIGILVNNVGLSYAYPEYFMELPNRDQFIMDLLHVNVVSCTMMTGIVLPGMLEHKSNKKGLVINLASLSGVYPCPLLSVYSACKSYVLSFTTCLRSEYADKGIDVQCIIPSFVSTNMSKIRSSSWLVPSPKTYVNSALASVATSSENNGVLSHYLLGAAIRNLPIQIPMAIQMSLFLKARRRHLSRHSKKE